MPELTRNDRDFPISIRIGNGTDDYTLATDEQRDTFLSKLDQAMAARGFETDTQWSEFQDTQIDGTSIRRDEDLNEKFPGIIDAYEAAYQEALGL